MEFSTALEASQVYTFEPISKHTCTCGGGGGQGERIEKEKPGMWYCIHHSHSITQEVNGELQFDDNFEKQGEKLPGWTDRQQTDRQD